VHSFTLLIMSLSSSFVRACLQHAARDVVVYLRSDCSICGSVDPRDEENGFHPHDHMFGGVRVRVVEDCLDFRLFFKFSDVAGSWGDGLCVLGVWSYVMNCGECSDVQVIVLGLRD